MKKNAFRITLITMIVLCGSAIYSQNNPRMLVDTLRTNKIKASKFKKNNSDTIVKLGKAPIVKSNMRKIKSFDTKQGNKEKQADTKLFMIIDSLVNEGKLKYIEKKEVNDSLH